MNVQKELKRYTERDLNKINFANFFSAPGTKYINSIGFSEDEIREDDWWAPEPGVDDENYIPFHNLEDHVHLFQLDEKNYALSNVVRGNVLENSAILKRYKDIGLEKRPELIIPILQEGEDHYVLLTISFNDDGFADCKLYDPKGKFRKLTASKAIENIRQQLQNTFGNDFSFETIFLDRQNLTDTMSSGSFIASYIKSIAHGKDLEWASRKGSITLAQIRKRDAYVLHAYDTAESLHENKSTCLLNMVNPIKTNDADPIIWDADIGQELFSQMLYAVNSLLDEQISDDIKETIKLLLIEVRSRLQHVSPTEARILYNTLSAVYKTIKSKNPQEDEFVKYVCIDVVNDIERHLTRFPWQDILRYVLVSILILALLATAVTLIVALATPAAPISMVILGAVSSLFTHLITFVSTMVASIAGTATFAASSLIGGTTAAIITTFVSGGFGLIGLGRLGFFAKEDREDKKSMETSMRSIQDKVLDIDIYKQENF